MEFSFQQPDGCDKPLMVKAMKTLAKRKGRVKFFSPLSLACIFQTTLIGIGGIELAFLLFRAFQAPPHIQGMFAPLSGAALAFGVYRWAIHLSGKYQTNLLLDSPMYEEASTFDFSKLGLKVSAGKTEWFFAWENVWDVVDDEDGVFFFSGGFAVALPKSIVSADEYSALNHAVREWRGAADTI